MRVRLSRGVLFKSGANVKYLSFRRKRLAGGATNGAYTDPAAGLQTKSMKLSSGKQSVATAAAREFVAIPAFSGLMESECQGHFLFICRNHLLFDAIITTSIGFCMCSPKRVRMPPRSRCGSWPENSESRLILVTRRGICGLKVWRYGSSFQACWRRQVDAGMRNTHSDLPSDKGRLFALGHVYGAT